jgi:hypothetical protein
MTTARDIIARTFAPFMDHYSRSTRMRSANVVRAFEQTDCILKALTDAGYTIYRLSEVEVTDVALPAFNSKGSEPDAPVFSPRAQIAIVEHWAETDGVPSSMLPVSVRHKKRGSTYTPVCFAMLQAGRPVAEGERVVVYMGDADRRMWARPEREFFDGRFEPIAASEGDAP